jgi:DNA-binding Lrp family transcriptional regulator
MNDALKDLELKLIAELMKNSRRSDRELARVLGVSQPTVTRTIHRLVSEGIIKEYTVIPDYAKLGFQIMSITLAKLKQPISQEALQNARRIAHEMVKKHPTAVIATVNGIGLDADQVIITFHRDYSEYAELLNLTRQYPHVALDEIRSFLVDLTDKTQYRPLTFKQVADYLLKMKEKKE